MPAIRALVVTGAISIAVALQVALLPYFAYDGVTPNLALLVVVAAALIRGPEFAAIIGFLSGLALDLAPPADHVAGRWAMALVIVGYLAGRVRHDARTSAIAAVVAVAASSFVATSIFTFSGLVLRDPAVPIAETLEVLTVALVYDVLITPFVLPPMIWLFRGLERQQVAY